MKNILKYILLFVTVTAVVFSCKKDENRVVYQSGTAPVLSATSTDTIALSYANRNNNAVTFSWTNPNYQFNTGISSYNVNYLLEIDTVGSNFTNPALKQIVVSNNLSTSLLQTDLNSILLNQLNLDTLHYHHLEIRVVSTVNSGGSAVSPAITALNSNSLQLWVKPYAIPPAVNPPSSGQLFLVGSATAGGWNNPVPTPSQQFTQIDATHYTITVSLTGGNQYLFIPVNGDWSHKYGNACGSDGCNLATGDNFKAEGNNFTGPSATGNYKIDVDFQRGKFTVTPM